MLANSAPSKNKRLRERKSSFNIDVLYVGRVLTWNLEQWVCIIVSRYVEVFLHPVVFSPGLFWVGSQLFQFQAVYQAIIM